MINYLAIKEIWQVDERTLGVLWTDQKESRFDVVDLRKQCPCAVCTDEMTGKRKLVLTSIPETVRPVLIKSVGRYALSIRFGDGHDTGIYTFEYLKRLGPVT